MHVVHTVGSLEPQGGGPAYTVPALCRYTKAEAPHLDLSIFAAKGANEVRHDALPGISVRGVSGGWRSTDFQVQLNTVRSEKVGDGLLIIHDHGQWLPINHASAVSAASLRSPRIVSPRGMLSPWALNHRKWKKRLAWWLYARQDLFSATVIHATSELETNELRDLGMRRPIAIIPNGIEVNEEIEYTTRTERPYVLFMSRIHQKKGVRELLRVWETLSPQNWELVFAGFDEENILGSTALPQGVRYVGPVEGDAKRRLLQEASIFALPSYSENFGVVVAESLMAGVPVITTHGTPWQSLESERCGWWIPMTEDRLKDSLLTAIKLPSDERIAMGKRGREYAMRTFGWAGIARQMTEVYQWMISGGPAPSCVDLVDQQHRKTSSRALSS